MILDIAARRADLTPRRQAVWADGRWYDYAELNRRAEALAARLHEAGVRRGDRVGILANNHLAHIDLLLATPKLGFIFTPFNHRLSDTEQRALGEYMRPTVMLYDEEFAVGATAAAAGGMLMPLSEYEAWLDSAPAAPKPPHLAPDDIQMILFTGGTTGVPKGAMLPYRQGFYNVVNTVLSWGLRPDDCAVQATPCFHAALNALTVPLLHAGARVVLQRSFEPGEYLRLAAEHGASILFLVPTMYAMLARHEDFADADLSGVNWAISGGAPCPESTRAAFATRGIPFRQGYGLTEAGVNCFAIDLDDAARLPLSVGRPMLHAEAVIRNGDGSPAVAGEIGELTLRGPHVFAGYYGRPEATAAVLKDGWLWTGDLARQDEDGNFYLAGRRKDMFISGGENVFPAEIENELAAHPAVVECAVIGVPDEVWGESGLAFVVPARGHGRDAGQLKEYLRTRLARYKVPKRFVFMERLPKSSAGKVLAGELRKLALEEA